MPMQEFVNRVRATAITAGGGYVPFSQCLEPTATLIKMMPQTSGGICEALSAKWIAEHANDRSLWNWLCTPGTTNVRQGMIANIMINFIEGDSSSSSSPTHNPTIRLTRSERKANDFQAAATKRFLSVHGVIPRKLARSNMMRIHSYSNGHTMGSRMARDLDPDLWNGQNFYLMIGIMGPNGGHAMAAFVGRNDIAFFDPNFGEFYFETRAKFKTFMKDFWRTSGYRNDYTGYQLWTYGKSI